ncbi:Lrp/AsnC family transcriptional regulator [Candidatus Woesearchaeota archaeon]|nr:Lrp/AsnC family transcriptional regulator [Candidatus Woesearchaeota archaeon]
MISYLLISLAGEKPAMVAQELLKLESVENVHVVYGDCDLIVHAFTENLIDLRESVLTNVVNLKGVKRVSTLIVAE